MFYTVIFGYVGSVHEYSYPLTTAHPDLAVQHVYDLEYLCGCWAWLSEE